ncbi:conserved hypothetical bacteriophage protein [Mycobacterium marinum M]|uniref:Uncharacterized protein n=3 Tax=Mycobacterium marinum TaxID=1781 RepID=A0A3E2MW96_MYCMR|nr:conserved hypothetical bacteriophage protein [Mycobacterium marinum M]RFZ41416.1 hypothetical protein DAVIS_02685 [Mycobacterium marinum]
MSYGLPTGTNINYGQPGFPDWVYQLGAAFNLRASTYPGHQESDRVEAGYARNPNRQNRGIDWAGAVPDMDRFAEYLLSTRGSLEQVIWQNPATGARIGVAGGKDVTQTAYYAADYSGHTDHVHTRQSEAIPMPDAPPKDTLFADVSEWQVPVDDSYPYPVLSIRVSDGSYQDRNFARNYTWMRAALNSGKLTFGIVYTYVRPQTWQSNAATVKQMIDAAGGLHPRIALMLDIESGGNPPGDQSGGINAIYSALADYTGDPARIIGYGNVSDLNGMWRTKPPGIRLIVAGYGRLPTYPGMVAHQYTDGQGYGGGLPEGCPPFGNCDMNAANGLTPAEFAAACGISGDLQPEPDPEPGPPPAPAGPVPVGPADDQLTLRWPCLGDQTLVEAVAEIRDAVLGTNDRKRGW